MGLAPEVDKVLAGEDDGDEEENECHGLKQDHPMLVVAKRHGMITPQVTTAHL